MTATAVKLTPFLSLLCGVLAVGSIRAAQEQNVSVPAATVADAGDASSVDELSRKTSDPTASLRALNFPGIYSTFHLLGDSGLTKWSVSFTFTALFPSF